MDITSLALADTATIHLKSPAGDLLYDGDQPVRIVIYGPGSRPYAQLATRQSARVTKRMAENDNKVSSVPHEQFVAETAEDLASITVAFENLSHPGAKGEQGVALYKAVYGDPKLPWITRQVSRFIADQGNFTPGSAGI